MSRTAGSGSTVEVARPSLERPSTPSVPPRAPAWLRPVLVVACVSVVAAGLLAAGRVGVATHAARVGAITEVLALVSLIATSAYLAMMVALHLLPTGRSPISQAVSDYGVGRHRGLFTVALWVSALAVLALAFALMRGVGSPPLATAGVVSLLLIPLARVGMTLFPTILEGRRASRTGLLHYAFAVTAFTLTYLAVTRLTPSLRDLDPGGWARGPLGWTSQVVGPALAAVVVTMLPPLRRVFGLVERVFLLATNVWIVLVAALVLSRS